jgi:hypothetical protein
MALLSGHIRNLLASLKYRGKLSIEFPVQYAEIVVAKKSGNWFTSLLRLTPTKKFEVVSVEWDICGGSSANTRRGNVGEYGEHGEGPGSSPDRGDQGDTSGVVVQAWWKEWAPSIWNAVLSGRKGWVTVEDWIEARMGVREKEKPREWAVDYE